MFEIMRIIVVDDIILKNETILYMLVDSKLCTDKIDFRQEISNSNKFDRDKWVSFI